jgi:hypothetical protein
MAFDTALTRKFGDQAPDPACTDGRRLGRQARGGGQ